MKQCKISAKYWIIYKIKKFFLNKSIKSFLNSHKYLTSNCINRIDKLQNKIKDFYLFQTNSLKKLTLNELETYNKIIQGLNWFKQGTLEGFIQFEELGVNKLLENVLKMEY